MKRLFSELKFFVTDTFASRGEARPAPDGLAKTIGDASHVARSSAAAGSAAGQRVYDEAAKGHENYQASFDDKKSR